MNALTEIQPQSPSNGYSAGMSALMLELAKSLKLVAPITMTADAQMVWLQAAVDALEDIRPDEVKAVSAELRRTVTRPSQIVPEIAKLVHAKRQRSQASTEARSPYADEIEIAEEAQKMRAKAKTAMDIEEAYEWERNALYRANCHVPPKSAPLSREELASLPHSIRVMGLNSGFLKRDGDRLFEVGSHEETQRIRDEMRRAA